ncbi:MAG TPA: ATP phosphoribosyltransferase [Alphaproteobacteria bacterium]|nr:ATP phosphoribosyltransferase [Alphaproteobacteria bacterium]
MSSAAPQHPLILALPKGRILSELSPLLEAAGIVPEADFKNDDSRALKFSTNVPGLDIIRVRAFDVATFVAYGAADIGIVGSDVLEEFEYDELYTPLDLNLGHCRLSVAAPVKAPALDARTGHIRVATKYPNLTQKHFAAKGIQAECIKLNGAMEIAPALNLAGHIVDLVSTGSTLKANGLTEVETIMNITSRLIVNRSAMKTKMATLQGWISRFESALSKAANAA